MNMDCCDDMGLHKHKPPCVELRDDDENADKLGLYDDVLTPMSEKGGRGTQDGSIRRD